MNLQKKSGLARRISFLLFLLLIKNTGFAQTPFGSNINWQSGYSKEISGENITYFSAYPNFIDQALLTRVTDGKKTIEWQTAPVASPAGGYSYFRWVAAHSTGTNSGIRHFDLYINGDKALTFITYPGNNKPVWSFAADDSTRLVFVQSKTDAANDAHGIAYLRVPASRIKPSQAQVFKIVGEAEQSNDWFMTFKYAFEEKADLAGLPFLLKDGNQPISLNVLHFGRPENMQVIVNKNQPLVFQVKEGMNSFDIPVTATLKKDSIHILAKYGDSILTSAFVQIEPVVKREIHFIHHSHTDIGYSYLQTEVERIHIKNIYDALRMIEKTKEYPEDAKFKWNIECNWAVENFLRQASADDKERFFTAVRAGSICISGFYANMLTGVSMPEELYHYTDYAEILREKYHLPIESALISDVPGIAWATVAGLSKGGIKYLSDGPNYLGKNNPYLGDRVGYFVKEWGDKPVWMLSPSGNEKILLWTGAKGYSSWHGNAPGAIFLVGAKKIAAYLNELTENNYPYEMVQWRYNCVSDNGPIDSTISDFVKQWNEKYQSPRIVLNTANKMFEEFESRYGKDLPQVKGDITPYWEDGAASTAYEEGLHRVSTLRCQQLSTLYALLAPSKYNYEGFYDAWAHIQLFTEHTWGAYNSISEPDLPFVKEQWRVKKEYLSKAVSKIDQLTDALLIPLIDSSSRKIAVVNTLSWQRSGTVYLQSKLVADFVTDEKGNQYPVQQLSDGRKLFIAKNLPPVSVSFFQLGNNNVKRSSTRIPFAITDSSVSNGKIKIEWDRTNGSITRFEKDGINYSGSFGKQGLNGYWYVPGRDPVEAVSNDKVTVKTEEEGANTVTINISSSAPGTKGLVRKITLFANDDKILLDNAIDKIAIRTKEGVYFSFPFSANLNKNRVDVGYGEMEYLKDQLPGSNMDFLLTRRWLDASDNSKGVQLMMIESFMTAPDSMIDERLVLNQSFKKWKSGGQPTSTWFSYVMNNYWTTNYKIDQDGISHYHYELRPHGAFDSDEQEKAAMEFTQPLVAFPVNEKTVLRQSIFELSNNKVAITSITPETTGGFRVRVFNPGSAPQAVVLQWNKLKPQMIVNGFTKKEIGAEGQFTIAGYDTIDVIVK